MLSTPRLASAALAYSPPRPSLALGALSAAPYWLRFHATAESHTARSGGKFAVGAAVDVNVAKSALGAHKVALGYYVKDFSTVASM